MSSIGLPRILEQTVNTIFEVPQLSSYKIAGNGSQTTIVLRFDERTANGSVTDTSIGTSEETKKYNIIGNRY